MNTKQRQELHCHECNRWVQFEIDLELDGNHVLNCPNCGHEHCRVVRKGQITDIRWASRNGATYPVTGVTTSTSQTLIVNVTATNWFTAGSWTMTTT